MAPAAAFIDLYERDAEPVLLFFTRRTLDVEVALDLTAETFAQAWRGWQRVRLDNAEEVRGWLFTIARRQLGRYLRRGTVERRALNRFGFSVPELAEDEIAEIERAAELDALRGALGVELRKLSDDQRDALQLRIVEELPYQEVARRLGTTEPTARARVSRGLRALAAALEPVVCNQRSTP
ncbi:MAG TPA: sigma-70 family RNA polymerase sigma factor [Solirubrobacteraceae bacterium]|nr:sigma-70 family RNA polymerase sigma factor [Solirubrobacteraceae bacterium]